MSQDQWDVFISHAHEDKLEIAKPLAEALKSRGYKVWYDEFSLHLGDSLRQSITTGLLQSKYGVVILSPHFFSKHWPVQELNGLAMREVNGQKVILPVWHHVTFEGVRAYSPILADRVAVSSHDGIEAVVISIAATLRGKADLDPMEQLQEELAKAHDVVLEALGGIVSIKTREDELIAQRVTAYAIAISRAVGMSFDESRVMARAAFLHDIGKLTVPDEILHKATALTPPETEILKQHCTKGYQLLRRIPFFRDAAELVLAQHEKWDGSGYPRGLKGEEIPLGSRIIAIADTLEALTTERSYRSGLDFPSAIDEIRNWSGRRFDPKLVERLGMMPVAIWPDLRREIEHYRQFTARATPPS